MYSRRGDETDCVTMTLFSKESADGSYNQSMFREVDNVAAIVSGITIAAEGQRVPPRFVLYVNLIPDWSREGNSYTDEQYLAVKEKFMDHVRGAFRDFAGEFFVIDFYTQANISDAEKTYMHQLRSGGSNPDIMKTHAIVANRGVRHLQIDTNTKVSSFRALYMETFGLPPEEQRDGLNACLYSERYIAAHNKVVYTTENSLFAAHLAETFANFCELYGTSPAHKDAKANRIYGQLFVDTLYDVGLTRRGSFSLRGRPYRPANLDSDVYLLTMRIVSAVNRSWDTSKTGSLMDDLKNITPIQVGDAIVDFKVFEYLVKKYTAIFTEHAVTRSGNVTQDDREVRERLLEISDTTFEYRMLGEFYNHVCQNYPKELVESLARLIPDTPRGNILSAGLFSGCTVSELYDDPVREASVDLTPYAPATRDKDKFKPVPYSIKETSVRSYEAASHTYQRAAAATSHAYHEAVDRTYQLASRFTGLFGGTVGGGSAADVAKTDNAEKKQAEMEKGVVQRAWGYTAGLFTGGGNNDSKEQQSAAKSKPDSKQGSQAFFQAHDASQSEGAAAPVAKEKKERLTKTKKRRRNRG